MYIIIYIIIYIYIYVCVCVLNYLYAPWAPNIERTSIRSRFIQRYFNIMSLNQYYFNNVCMPDGLLQEAVSMHYNFVPQLIKSSFRM